MRNFIKTALVVVALFIGLNAHAQLPIQFGVKAGVNMSNLGGDYEYSKAKIGFNVGVTADIALPSNLYVMTGLEFTTKGAKVEYSESDEGITGKVTGSENAMYLQLPIHLGYKMEIAPATKIVFHAGPYLAYGIGGKTKIDGLELSGGGLEDLDIDEDAILDALTGGRREGDFFGDDAKKFDYGIGLGVGVEFGKIGVGLGYDFGLANISNIENYKVKNQNAYLTVGYKF